MANSALGSSHVGVRDRAQMDDGLGAGHRRAHQFGVLQIAGVDPVRPRVVDGDQVGGDHLVPVCEQFFGDMAADVARRLR